MAIVVSKNGKGAKRVDKSSFGKEDYLQKYIYENPDSIPLYEIKENVKVLILARELQTQSGPLDAVGIDREGDVYVIETKLYKNPDKRQVVAQALDYGASLWKHTDFEEFIRKVSDEVSTKFGMSLEERISDFFAIDDTNALLDSVKNNLNDGRIKFIVLMDKLHPQLKDLILFINQNSQFDIYAVELEYYKYDNYEIMIPKIFGAEVKKDLRVKSPVRKRWDEKRFFEDATKKLDKNGILAVRKVYELSKSIADRISWGTGVENGSFNPKIDRISVRSLFTVYSDGTFQINFAWLNDDQNAENVRDNFGKMLGGIDDLKIPDNYAKTYVNISIKDWCGHVDKIVNIISSIVN